VSKIVLQLIYLFAFCPTPMYILLLFEYFWLKESDTHCGSIAAFVGFLIRKKKSEEKNILKGHKKREKEKQERTTKYISS
jgi:hypothetical protein